MYQTSCTVQEEVESCLAHLTSLQTNVEQEDRETNTTASSTSSVNVPVRTYVHVHTHSQKCSSISCSGTCTCVITATHSEGGTLSYSYAYLRVNWFNYVTLTGVSSFTCCTPPQLPHVVVCTYVSTHSEVLIQLYLMSIQSYLPRLSGHTSPAA